MKKLSLILASTVLMLLGCSREPEINVEDESPVITCCFAANDVSKTTPLETQNGLSPRWKAGDKVKVYGFKDGAVVGPIVLTLTDAEGDGSVSDSGKQFSFHLPYSWDLGPGDLICAMYPADVMTGAQVSSNSCQVLFNVPDVQDGTFASANICAAQTSVSDAQLSFVNVTTLFKVTVPNDRYNKLQITMPFDNGCGPSVAQGFGNKAGELSVSTSKGSCVVSVNAPAPVVYFTLSPSPNTIGYGSSFEFLPSEMGLNAGDVVKTIDLYSSSNLLPGLYYDLGFPWNETTRTISFSASLVHMETSSKDDFFPIGTKAAVTPASSDDRTVTELNSFPVLSFFNYQGACGQYFEADAVKGLNVEDSQYYGLPSGYFWPSRVEGDGSNGNSLSFFIAIGAEIDNKVFDFGSRVFPSFHFKASNPATQKDILVGESILIPYLEQVPVTINHVLSQVRIKVACQSLDKAARYTVNEATLGLWESNDATEPGDHKHQIVTDGTFSFGNGTSFSASRGYCWDIDYNKKTGYNINIASDFVSGKEVAAGSAPDYLDLISECCYWVLPQYCKSMIFAITYKVETYDTDGKTLVTVFDGTKYYDIAATQRSWQPGKSYEYDILIDASDSGQTPPVPYGVTPDDPDDPDPSSASDHDPDVPFNS